MALVVKINGVNRSSYIEPKSVRMDDNLSNKVDTLSFMMRSHTGKPFAPVTDDEVSLELDGEVLFNGSVMGVTRSVIGADLITHRITAKDITHDFDRILVVKKYEELPVINIISDILNRFVNAKDRLEMATFETNEIWSGGAVDTTNYRTDTQARKLTSTNAVMASMSRQILLDLSQKSLKGKLTPAEKVTVTDAATIQNVFDSGGAVSVWIRPQSDGQGDQGRIIDKAGWWIRVDTESAGTAKLTFFQDFSGTDGQWSTTSAVIAIDEWSHIVVSYNNGATTNDPTVYVNNVAVAMTETSTPVGTRVTDVASDLILGNRAASDRTFDGQLDEVMVYGSTLTVANVDALYRLPSTPVSGIISHWKCDEVNPLTVLEDSEGANDGTNSGATMVSGVSVKALDFGSSDYIDIDSYVDTFANLDTVVMKMGNDAMTSYYSLDITNQYSADGWNYVHVLRSAFAETGTPDWEAIEKIVLEVTSVAATTVVVTFDNWNCVRKGAYTRDEAYTATQVVQRISFNYELPSSCMTQMAKLFQWYWYIDVNKAVNFFKKFDKGSPFQLTDTGGNYVYGSLDLVSKSDQIKNSVIVRGGDYEGSLLTDDLSHQVDGTNKIFKLGFRYKNYDLTLDGDALAVGIDNIDAYADVESVSQKNLGSTALKVGDDAARTYQSQQIISTRQGRFSKVILRLRKVGTPGDLTARIFSDDGSNRPTTTALSTASTVSAASVTASYQEITIAFTETATNDLLFEADDLFHIRLTAAVDASNYYEIDCKDGSPYDGKANVGDGTPVWTAHTSSWYFIELLSFEVLYSFNEKILTFSTAPAGGSAIVWTGNPLLPVIVHFKENGSIAVHGEYQSKIIDKTISSREAAIQRASEEVLAWAETIQDGSFETDTDGLKAGMTINVQSDIRGVDEDFLINKVSAKAKSPTALRYTVELISRRTIGIIEWLQNQILKDDKQIIIDDNELFDQIEGASESFSFSEDALGLTLYVGKVYSNDAGTTPDKLIFDGGATHIFI